MKDREKEYKEIFIAEALQEYDDLSRHIVHLEQEPENDRVLGEIFRLFHNLKANAKAMGYTEIADLSHRLESVFSLIRQHQVKFTGNVITVTLDGFDFLGLLLKNIDKNEPLIPHPDLLINLERIVEVAGTPEGSESIKKIYTSQTVSLSDLIYIHVKKLDTLMNLVGELIIDRDRILSISEKYDDSVLRTVSSHLERITNELQFSVMDARLVNIGTLFNKFPRIVRDIAVSESKSVKLELFGQDIQIDRNILQIITDSLIHIIRNAISHGIESPSERKKKNKNETGLIVVSAVADKDTVVLQIRDDGKGIELEKVRQQAIRGGFINYDKSHGLNSQELLSLIFEPGFSLSESVSEYSGRGVGLDVVKNALDSIGGRIAIESNEEGTTFSLHLPNSIAVKGALLFETRKHAYAIPLLHTEQVVNLTPSRIHKAGESLFTDVKGETLPLIDLDVLFHPENPRITPREFYEVVVVTYNNRKLGLIVDKLLRQQDIVVKTLQKPVDHVDLFGGVTLLGSGEICLVLDVPAISRAITLKRELIKS